jgi:hypothetical protein
LRVGEEGVDDGSVGEGEGLVGGVGVGESGGGGVEAGVVDDAAGVDAAAAAAAVAGVDIAVPDDIDIEDSKKRKRPVLRLKLRSPTKTNATAVKNGKTDATSGEGGKSDEDLKAFVSAQSSPEPAKKRQKTLETNEAGIAASLETITGASLKANAAAARAVVFGLRVRK